MATMASSTLELREAVLRELHDGERQPMDLLKHLGEAGYPDSAIKQALSELIHEGSIELTSRRVLKAAVHAA